MNTRSRSRVGTDSPYLAALMMLFVGSGCAALIYQIVWLQLLQLVVGSSAISLGVLVATFMGGMCAGSFLLPRLVGVIHHPLRSYAYLEIGIALSGLLLLFGMPLVNGLYAFTGGGVAIRALLAAVCLMPPTMMMGATLPVIARWVETTRSGVAWLGFFYGGNITGAVIGTLVTGFYLLPVYDAAIATYTAVGINAIVAIVALRFAAVTAYAAPRLRPPTDAGQVSLARDVHVAAALSGLSALGCEVIWTRLLSLAVGATVYAFSLILAVFLAGLGLGSGISAVMARRASNPRAALGWCQVFLCAAIAWAAYQLTEALPFAAPPISSDPWASLQFDLVRCGWVVLPGAMLWGASFPLALAAAARPGQDPGHLVGRLYAANTLGAITGSLGAVVLAATVGSQHALQVFIAVAALSALVVFAPWRGAATNRLRPAIAAVLIAIAALLVWRVSPVPGVLIAYGRNSASWAGMTNIVYAGEGLNAFVAVSKTASGAPIYHAAGKVQASSEGEDMRLQRMLAHFSHLIPHKPKSVLVIGLGAGFTAGAVAIAPGVEQMKIVEIERLVPTLSGYFADYNYHVATNPKVSIRIDDARHYLMTTNETFDVITSDLVDPWVKGTAALFTREFFELMKGRLKPGGVVTMFVQLYLSNAETVKSEIATFMEVFPDALVWGNTMDGQGYDLVLTGQAQPTRIDVDEVQARLDTPEYAQVAASLREIGFKSAIELLSSYAGSKSDLSPWLRDAIVNRDRHLRLQYLAGMGATLQQSGPIYAEMTRDVKFPVNLFQGSKASIDALTESVARALGRAGAGGRP